MFGDSFKYLYGEICCYVYGDWLKMQLLQLYEHIFVLEQMMFTAGGVFYVLSLIALYCIVKSVFHIQQQVQVWISNMQMQHTLPELLKQVTAFWNDPFCVGCCQNSR